MKFHTGKTILENLTADINATNIKYIEKYLFFNTSFLVKLLLIAIADRIDRHTDGNFSLKFRALSNKKCFPNAY